MVNSSVDIARAQERIDALERWQAAQNGQLKDLNEKIDHLAEKVDSRILSLHDRINGVNRWLVGVLSSSILGLIMLVLNLIIDKP